MGNSRTPLRLTAIAASTIAPPLPSADMRMTCAGPAQITTVEVVSHQAEKPKPWASAPMPTKVPIITRKNTEVSEAATPPKKAADGARVGVRRRHAHRVASRTR